MNDEGGKSGSSYAIILAIVVIVVAAYSVMYGLQTLAWVEAKQWASVNPWLRDTPQPLPASMSEARGTLVKAYDYEFMSPWGAGKITPYPAHVEFRFGGGQAALFIDPETSGQTKTLPSITGTFATASSMACCNASRTMRGTCGSQFAYALSNWYGNTRARAISRASRRRAATICSMPFCSKTP